jgi:2-keto-3-deoxy-L-rhamnonate aldolase RhmA
VAKWSDLSLISRPQTDSEVLQMPDPTPSSLTAPPRGTPLGLTGLRSRLLEDDRQLLGTFVTIPRVEVVEIAAIAGMDVVVLDCEHGPFGVESISSLIAAGQGLGLDVVVRVPENRAQLIGAALDAGANGVLVPHVDSRASAEAAAIATRFPPRGDRSVHNWVRAARYGENADYMPSADAGVALLLMAEGREAIDNLSDVLAEPEADCIFIGPMDLAASLGLEGQPGHPRVREIASAALAEAKRAGKASAVFAPTVEAAEGWFAAGAGLVVLSVDTDLIMRGFSSAVGALGRPRSQPATAALPQPATGADR